MKKSAAANNVVRGQKVAAKSNKSVSWKKADNVRPAAGQKKSNLASDAVTLTQSEYDAILGAISSLSMAKS